MLHGLFGDRDNLRSLALHLERARPVIRLNLAGHGGAPAPASLTLDSLADAVARELADANIERCHLIGHSLGGKVAMTLAGRALARQQVLAPGQEQTQAQTQGQTQGQTQEASPELESLIVLDIAPKHYAPHHRPLLDAMAALDLTAINTRKEADTALRDSIPHAGTRAFLLKSLARNEDTWQWQFALDRLVADYDQLGLPPPLVEPQPGTHQAPSLFIRGTESDYLVDDDVALVKRFFAQAEFRAVKAGHWLHAEKPAQIAELCEDFLRRQSVGGQSV